ncbi:MAG: GNAT family N-acetyltransferase [Pseudomonadota bacterium]|nr:GNAT family N-acetyltransferase [Pseudomonadota bacterium]
MNLADPQALAALHACCFDRPRPWSAEEFAGLLASPGVFLLSDGDGFLLGRALACEAELLTLAVAPGARRAGLGLRLVRDFAAEAAVRRADEAFLEVAADNLPARRLYDRAGWLQAGLRRGYYGVGSDAIVMRLTLRAGQEGG